MYKIINEIYDTNVATFLKTIVQSADRTAQEDTHFNYI